jgi:DNA-binding NarL/FixJ family response regulator
MQSASRTTTDEALTDELEAIAVAAAERLRAQTRGDHDVEQNLKQGVANAASGAITAGLPLAAIADAERVGEARARDELRPDVLRQITRAARHKRDSEAEYEQAVIRAARLGLPHREIATAADVTHGTVRAIIDRVEKPSAGVVPSTEAAQTSGPRPELPQDPRPPITARPPTREAARP